MQNSQKGQLTGVFGIVGLLVLISSLIGPPVNAGDAESEDEDVYSVADDPIGAPMRVRDFTFPTYLLLSFAPQPAAPLTQGKWAFEIHYSAINNFQVSQTVEDYLEQVRDNRREPLNQADADFILSLPQGEGFYIDGEFQFLELVAHYGITDRLDIGFAVTHLDFSGGYLDGTIFDFHDQFGYGQQGRNFVADEQFQIVIGQDGQGLTLLDGPPSGGFGDPSLFFRYFLGQRGRWSFSLGGGIKVPVADERFLSSGNWDLGLTWTAQASWKKNALFFNLAAVEAGEFEDQGVDPPILPSLNVSWIRAFGKNRQNRVFLQLLVAEHAFSDLFDSDLSELELQFTLGFKRATRAGVFGFGLTENILAYDNTPDIGIHLSWGYLLN